MEKKAKIITVAGKGGVGKTSVSACMVRLLVEKYPDKKILAIDADPAVGLSVALGVDVKLTLDDIRMSIVDSVENGDAKEALELLSEARFRIFDALVEMPGFAFLAIGRPESSGCYCKVNSYLKEVIGLLANSFDYVVIDGEAGIEQIQRRVMEKVTHLLLVTDQSKKGGQVITTIKSVADELIAYDRIGVIVNRVTNPELADMMQIPGLEILSLIPADSTFATTSGKLKFSGTYTFSPEDDTIVLDYGKEGRLGGVSLKAGATVSLNTMELLFNADKLLDFIEKVSSVAGGSGIGSLTALLNQYDGIKIGFSLSRKSAE